LTGCGQLDGDGKYFIRLAEKIRDTEKIVCVFPAQDRLFRPIGFDQYCESDFELFRQKLVDAGCNPKNITFALLNDGTLESDRAYETRLGENYVRNQKQVCKRIDPKTSERLKEEVNSLATLGMSPPDICFHFATRLEQVKDRTVREWYQKAGFTSKWDNILPDVYGLAIVNGMNARDVYRHVKMLVGEVRTLRTIQDKLQGAGASSKRGKPKHT
jgi:hypothetical protein